MKKISVLISFLISSSLVMAQSLTSGINKANFDQSVRPQDDLYNYVNGTWLKNTPIPSDKSNYGTFTILDDLSQKRLHEIIEEAAHSYPKYANENMQKVGDLYLSFMDTVAIEKLGVKPIEKDIETIKNFDTKEGLTNLLGYLGKKGVQRPFGIYLGQDAKKSTEYIFYMYQSGTGLPDRDYYLSKDTKFQDIRTAYEKYISTILKLANQPNNDAVAKKILEMETALATIQWTRIQNRDDNKTYNKMTIDELQKLTSNINWNRLFKESDMPEIKNIIVSQPDFISNMNGLLGKYSTQEWKNYFIYKVINSSASYLSSDFVTAQFNFFSKTLRGVAENTPRWKRGVSLVEGVAGEVVGKIYVEKYFKPEAKKRMNELVGNLKTAFAERINSLEWMSEATKKQALDKLSKFTTKIAYPDVWKDYSKLKVVHGDLVQNVKNSGSFRYYDMLSKYGKPIDRTEWGMFPQTVNAYYSSTMNEIVFPAAILQPPFFDMSADDAVNYGGIGAVIGHEISHGFDDQGSRSDGDGNLRNWWASSDSTSFANRAKMLVDQYNQYNPIDTMHIRGAMTLGENIGDLGGMNVAYHAYKLSLKGKEAPVLDGFTGDQRFFIGWAQVWPRLYTAAEMRNRILTDEHSPSEYRVNGIVSNMPEFYKAFNVKPGDKLYRSDAIRVKIW